MSILSTASYAQVSKVQEEEVGERINYLGGVLRCIVILSMSAGGFRH